MGQRRLVLILFILAAFVVALVQCAEVKKQDPRGMAYAGSATCVKCHKDVSSSYIHNAHFNTSRSLSTAASADSLHLPVSNFIFTSNTRVGVEKRKSGLYQVAYINGKEVKAERTDIIFGSGNRAYTFGFWFGEQLMQMPLNFLTKQHQWVNSPGFPEEHRPTQPKRAWLRLFWRLADFANSIRCYRNPRFEDFLGFERGPRLA